MRQRQVDGEARWGACGVARPVARCGPLLLALGRGALTLPASGAALHRAEHPPHGPPLPERTHAQARAAPPEPLGARP